MSTTTSYRLSGIALVVISPKTVRNYVSNIISKLQVADRAQAILRAKDAGIGIPGSS
ncbi:MAG TPA: LuxR C-terminal-related transcriptional regulator [Ktedonobacteraceae bacterium]|nr:LuxR C-terminal-related transcriptional regulator [Ktedonobacteraceae bacterium]